MRGLIARVHQLQRGDRYPDAVDLVSVSETCQESLAGTVHIDTLGDMGVSPDAIAKIANGEEIEIVAFAAYELPDGLEESE